MSLNDKKGLADKKLSLIEARKHAARIAKEGMTRFSSHAKEELDNDDLNQVDAINVILSADARALKEPELKDGSYRYCIETQRIAVVVAFSSEDAMTVVTAWRKKVKGK